MLSTSAGESVSFRSLSVNDWRQFRSVELVFHDRLTVVTGSNGAGKTSILNLLSGHFAWSLQFLAGTSTRKITAGVEEVHGKDRRDDHPSTDPNWQTLGSLSYTNDVVSPILMPTQAGASTYNLHFPQQQSVPGLNLPSHRMIMGRTAVPTIPTAFSASNQLLESFLGEIRQRYVGAFSQRPPALVMKESLLAAQMYGEATASRAATPEAAEVWNGFQAILREVLPSSLGFEALRVDPPELVLQTRTGRFPLDSASGGISALFELSWQIFLRARQYDRFTVCVDEPENHLHPELQRALMPALLRAFPRIKFLVATHSPFVVTSVPDAHVYALNYIEGRVESRRLDTANLGADSDETLRDVLGLDSTLPQWAEQRLTELSERYLSGAPTPDALRSLRRELQELGMGGHYPAAVASAMDRLDAPTE
jgi:predicted ATPase